MGGKNRAQKKEHPQAGGVPRWGCSIREGEGRRRRTLPPGRPGSTIRAAGLNGRVRDGNECVPRAVATDHLSGVSVRGIEVGKRERGKLERVPVWKLRGSFWFSPAASHCATSSAYGFEAALSRSPDLRVPGERMGPGGRNAGQATRAISTARLHVLPRFHLPPIYVIVSHGPFEVFRPGSAHLGVGFPLRCFQRLSRPDVATRRCPWRDNRYTSGQSVPVLSY